MVDDVARLGVDDNPRIGRQLGPTHHLAHKVDIRRELLDRLIHLRRIDFLLGKGISGDSHGQ